MNVKELRIGNIIGSKSSTLPYWEIRLDDMAFIAENPDHYFPIPLTEDWLIKLGFIKLLSGDKFLTRRLGFSYYIHLYKDNFILRNFDHEEIIKLKSIHQLHNIYFALTGEELTIDPSRD